MKKLLGIMVLGLLLSGCFATTNYTSTWQHFNDCSVTHSKFTEMVKCGELKRNNYVQSTRGATKSQLGNSFVRYAKILAQQVENNEITETAANLKLLELEQKFEAEYQASVVEAQKQNNQALRDFTGGLKSPTTTNCSTIGSSTSCTTY